MFLKQQYLITRKQINDRHFTIKNQRFYYKIGVYKNLKQQNINCILYYKPANILDIHHLSKILKRPIYVWSKQRLICAFNNRSKNPKINIEFCEHYLSVNRQKIGHFTLKNGKEPNFKESTYPNNCLFDVVAVQTGYDANDLRRQVSRRERMKRKKYFDDLSHGYFFIHPDYSNIYGGARYKGKSKEDAARVLDASQYGKSHPNGLPGHPRGHASHPTAKGVLDSVENYSKYTGLKKTGFLSRDDQDMVAHNALLNADVQETLELMNEMGEKINKIAVKVSADKLYKPPKVQDWDKGKKVGKPELMRAVRLVMKHFHDKYDDEDSDVFVLTFFPMIH